MTNYVMAVSAADDAIVFPIDKIRTISCETDQHIFIRSEPGIADPTGADAETDHIDLTITADTEVAVIKVLVEKLLGAQNGPGGQAGVFMICDDVNSVFAHPNILSCVIVRAAV